MRSITGPSKAQGKRRPRWQRWASRLVLAVALAVGLAYLPYKLLDGSGMGRAAQLNHELDRTRKTIGELRIENQQYRREIDALKNEPGAIEDIARSALGMVRPGDVVIRVDSGAAQREGAR